MDVTPETFVADYTGKPGNRTFFVQSRGDSTHTFQAEKQQVQLLAERLREMLVLLDANDPILSATPARDPELKLEPPLEPEWRIGTIAIGYVEDSDEVVVSFAAAQEEPPEDLEEMEFDTRFLLNKDQVRAFILHALATVAEGRPLCQLCGLPMDPEGHNCPASNGHRAEV